MTSPTTAAQETESLPWLPIAATIAVMGVFAMTFGLTYPLLSLVLEGQGHDPSMIGLNAAMTPLGIIFSAPFLPRLAQKFGAWRMAVGFILAISLLVLMLGAWRNIWAWFALRFLLGIAIDGLFIISETWINQMATKRTRGRVMGLYTTTLAGGFTLGPLTISIVGSDGWIPFLIGCIAPLLVLPLLASVRGRLPRFEAEEPASILAFLPLAPLLLGAVGIMAFFDSAALALFPVYGLGVGLAEATTATALAVLIAGNVVFQFPIGWLADRVHRRTVMVICTAFTILGALVVPYVIQDEFLRWPVLFFWGAMAFGVYPVAMAELGDRFSGAMLLAGNAAFAVMWGVGGIVGAPSAGAAMESFGPHGLPGLLALCYAFYLVMLLVRRT